MESEPREADDGCTDHSFPRPCLESRGIGERKEVLLSQRSVCSSTDHAKSSADHVEVC